MLSLEQKRDLCQTIVTLDGQAARICGAQNQYATVRQLKSALSCEYTWDAVELICKRDGRFKS